MGLVGVLFNDYDVIENGFDDDDNDCWLGKGAEKKPYFFWSFVKKPYCFFEEKKSIFSESM